MSTISNDGRMRVLVVGGGIAGLTLAHLLIQQGLRPVVVDRRPARRQGGYILGLWPLGSCVLKGIGLYSDFERRSSELVRFDMADMDGEVLHSYKMQRVKSILGPIRMVRRADLVETLLEGLGDYPVRHDTTVTAIDETKEHVSVSFSDGSQEEFDLVVGCDGVNSVVRQLAFPEATPQATGWKAWGWWVDPNLAPRDVMVEHWHPDKAFCAIYPAPGSLCAFAGLPERALDPALAESDVEHVRMHLGKLGGSVGAAVEQLDPNETIFHDNFRFLIMDRWQKGRVTLAGDACSAYFPFGGLGIGASMAIESAAVLADVLSRADSDHIPIALHYYETRRRARITSFEEAARGVVDRMLRSSISQDELILKQKDMFLLFRKMLQQPL